MRNCSLAPSRLSAFSLIEVVLALGIFLVTILALIGLLGPTLKSVDDVENADEVASIVNTVNAFLQSSPKIAPGASKFDAIYNAVASGDHATLFAFRAYRTNTSDEIIQKIGFDGSESVGTDAKVAAVDFENAAGRIYRVVLSASSVLPVATRSASRNGSGVYTLVADIANYSEGSFAMEIRIFAREADMAAASVGAMPTPTLADLAKEEPIFTYNTAILR